MTVKRRSNILNQWQMTIRRFVAPVVIMLLVASSGWTSASASPTSTTAAGAVKSVSGELANFQKGNFSTPPTSPSPGVKKQNIWVVEWLGATTSSTVPVAAIKAADAALGWKTTVYDAQGLPSNYVIGVNEAIANGANGIILIAVDCSYVEGPLKQAKADHIAVTAIYGFDCSQWGGGPRLYSAGISFGKRFTGGAVALWHQWGIASADYVISATHGKPVTLMLDSFQLSVFTYYYQGFLSRMNACQTCTVIKVPWDISTEFTGTAIAGLITAAYTAHPNINSSLLGTTVDNGFSQGINSLGPTALTKMKVIGGLGLPSEFLLMRSHQSLTATTAWPQQWIGYAAVDSINSFLAHKPLQDEGIGFQVFDPANSKNWPAVGKYFTGVPNYAAIYKKRWGV
jgi:ribose transport system substrate-binding protein